MDRTEKSIFEQFEFWNSAPRPHAIAQRGDDYVVVGCGTSYNLAMSAAIALNESGFSADGKEYVTILGPGQNGIAGGHPDGLFV